MAFVDQHRDAYGVEPIYREVPIAPATYYQHTAWQVDPTQRSRRAQRDDAVCDEIQLVWEANQRVYGPRQVYRQLRREGRDVARCTVERLMRRLGLHGVVRGAQTRTTWPEMAVPCPLDRVARTLVATRPNQLWVADLTYVVTWRGFVYAAFVIDVFARCIVGWRPRCAPTWPWTRSSRRSRKVQIISRPLVRPLGSKS